MKIAALKILAIIGAFVAGFALLLWGIALIGLSAGNEIAAGILYRAQWEQGRRLPEPERRCHHRLPEGRRRLHGHHPDRRHARRHYEANYLAVCDTIKFPNGDVGIICGARHRPRYCTCGRESSFLCDRKVSHKKSGTCDAPICAQHALQVGPRKHLCPLHQKEWERWKTKHPPAQASLFEVQQ
jgi:hypothetical protein